MPDCLLGATATNSSEWEEKFDENGYKYYCNTRTRKQTWTAPEISGTQSNSGDWITKTDPESGQPYYENVKTKQKSWTAPLGSKASAKQRTTKNVMKQVDEGERTSDMSSMSGGSQL